ncbi:outer membrane protein assembly factor BamB family protein [Chitinophaga arvensicola]|uniref:Outer membrane protein assembly factor BamB, contains PQQ-like beta-propeller repeat n=1 Tax=Chitinophaga arvensicola TaxID=29529 RepID=A0A1I0S5G7_9BACT|nr:PQQ-binding-like beta-propeller repeat protein [Chitinophaga arvensicola]SEW49868.1 Outer membrane protein assembly factor BamB, contains PQQ-like beta-propeller repeat [Chitinophaga arvensicola]
MKALFWLAIPLMTLHISLSAQQLGRSASRANYHASADIPDKPAVKWQFKTNGKVISSPVINGSHLFIGSTDSCMYALDRTTGTQRWKFKTNGAVNSSVACDSSAIYFLSEDGFLYAVDMNTGQRRWSFKTGGEHATDPWDYFLSSAAINKGVVYVGSTDGHIYAINARTGKLQWKFRTGGAVHAAPTVAKDIILAGSFDGFFYALNPNGSLRWKFNTIGERFFPVGAVQFHAVVADTCVYFCARDYNVYSLDLRTGVGFWVYHEPGSWSCVPSLAGERLLVSTSDSYRALSFDALYGNLQWKSPVHLNVFSSIASTNAYGYMGSLDGKLLKMDLRTGEGVTLFQTAASAKEEHRFFNPDTKALFPDLMARYKDDYIKMYADFLDMGSILSTPWLEEGVLYFGSTDGNVYALQ